MRKCAAGILFIVATFGCGKSVTDTPILIDEVPVNLLKIANEKLPNVKFDQAIRRSDGSFEIRGKDAKGKVRDIDLAADGKVIEIE